MATQHSPAQITAVSATQTSLLLDLPAELRNTIYRMVLVAEDPFELAVTKQHCSKLACRIQLLHLCQQIRNEAHDIFWAENKFQITAVNSITDQAFPWLKRFGPRQTSLIKHLTIEYRVPERYQTYLPDRCDVYFYSVDFNIRRLIWRGIRVSSIKLITPPGHDSARTVKDQLLAEIQEEFNAVVKQALRTPGWEQQKKLNARQYQEIRTAPCKLSNKVLTAGNKMVEIMHL